jgi:hypothetical protein
MSTQLQPDNALADAAQETPAQPQPAPPPAPVAPAAEGPPQLRPGPFLRVHHAVKEIEPWGILIAVVAVVLSLLTFWTDFRDRVDERRVRAWQLLKTEALGNSGKREALEYLNKEDGLFCFGARCLLTLQPQTWLAGLDLSSKTFEPREEGVFLNRVQLPGAQLERANLRGASLSGANLSNANLSNANLVEANLSNSDLSGANLSGAGLPGADLSGANLTGANLRDAWVPQANLDGADLRNADLRGANLSGANLGSASGIVQEQLAQACGNEDTILPAGMTVPPCAK